MQTRLTDFLVRSRSAGDVASADGVNQPGLDLIKGEQANKADARQIIKRKWTDAQKKKCIFDRKLLKP